MKIALGLALTCLLMAITFSISSASGPIQPSPGVVHERGLWSPIASWFGSSPSDDRPVQASDLLVPEGDEGDEGDEGEYEGDEEELVDEEAEISGRVGVTVGLLPEGATVQLRQELPPGAPDAGAAKPEGEDEGGLELEGDEAPVAYEETMEVDEAGEFSFIVPPGSYELVARATGMLPTRVEHVVVVAREELKGLSLDLSPGLSIRGLVRAAGEGQPAAMVVADGNGYHVYAQSDDDGLFELKGLPAGTYTVRCFIDFVGGDVREVRAGSSVTLELGKTRRLAGVVVDAAGMPVAAAGVYVHEVDADDGEERDPFGVITPGGDGLIGGLSGCGPMPDCRREGETDAYGRFDVGVAPSSKVVLAAGTGTLRSLQVEVVDGAPVRLVVRPVEPVRLRAVDAEQHGTLVQLAVSSDSPFQEAPVKTAADGSFTVIPWPGQPMRIVSADPDARIVADGPLPAGVELPRVRVRRVVRLYEFDDADEPALEASQAQVLD